MLTQNGVATATGLILLTILAWVTSFTFFIVASHLILITFLLQLIRFRIHAGRLNRIVLKREVSSDRLFVGHNFTVTIYLTSRNRRGSTSFLLKDMVPKSFRVVEGSDLLFIDLPAKESYKASYRLEALENGVFRLDKAKLYLFDPLTLFWTSLELESSIDLKIFPKITTPPRITIRSGVLYSQIQGDHPIRREGLGSEFYGIREYTPGDDFRSIAWKAMARSPDHRPMTEKQESERRSELIVVVHNTGSMQDGYPGRRKIVSVVEAAEALAYTAVREGDRLTLVYWDKDEKLHLHRCVGRNPLVEAMYILYNLTPVTDRSLEESVKYLSERLKSRSKIFIIADFQFQRELDIALLEQLKMRGHPVHLLLTSTCSFIEAQKEADTIQRLTYRVLDDIEKRSASKLVKEASRHGVSVDICGPDQLVKAALNRYIQLRRGGRRMR